MRFTNKVFAARLMRACPSKHNFGNSLKLYSDSLSKLCCFLFGVILSYFDTTLCTRQTLHHVVPTLCFYYPSRWLEMTHTWQYLCMSLPVWKWQVNHWPIHLNTTFEGNLNFLSLFSCSSLEDGIWDEGDYYLSQVTGELKLPEEYNVRFRILHL